MIEIATWTDEDGTVHVLDLDGCGDTPGEFARRMWRSYVLYDGEAREISLRDAGATVSMALGAATGVDVIIPDSEVRL